MDTTDMLGATLVVGDLIQVRAKIIDIVKGGDTQYIVALTQDNVGNGGVAYSCPTLHGSQVVKASR